MQRKAPCGKAFRLYGGAAHSAPVGAEGIGVVPWPLAAVPVSAPFFERRNDQPALWLPGNVCERTILAAILRNVERRPGTANRYPGTYSSSYTLVLHL